MHILKVDTEKRRLGNIGEEFACEYLLKSGYSIVERNFVAAGHEIDIIARQGGDLIFIEVKTRTTGKSSMHEPRPAASITKEKQQKLIATARVFASYNKPYSHLRFDVLEVYVTPDKKLDKIEHLESAFNRTTAYKRPWSRF